MNTMKGHFYACVCEQCATEAKLDAQRYRKLKSYLICGRKAVQINHFLVDTRIPGSFDAAVDALPDKD